VRGPAPRFAQHTREVLADCCGLSDDELSRLEAEGVIHSSGDVDTARPGWK
jgi:crotonobetainyl-CoA:carnitine CoA-transferase CaiB-like acyl-CoA transferase